ncbi:MAG: hypothetical protein H7Z43_01970, partial [Clostridia bacterium]|nr:hypothetical protein [Deltaproteobacteria bacterium]
MRKTLMVLAGGALVIGCGSGDKPAAKASPDSIKAVDVADREAYAKANNLALRSFDLNRDDKPDVFKFYRIESDPAASGSNVEHLARKDIDLNNDGKVDVIRIYNDKNEVIEERTDLDFDGRYDELASFEHAVVVRKEIDLDYDGKPEIIRYYADNKIGRIESDRNG